MELREGTDEDEDFEECEDKSVEHLPILEEDNVVPNCDNNVEKNPDKDLTTKSDDKDSKLVNEEVGKRLKGSEATPVLIDEQREMNE